MTKKQKRMLARIIADFVLLIVAVVLTQFVFKSEGDGFNYIHLICFLVPYLLIGYDVLKKAFMNIIRGQVFDENLLMTIATIGAFAMGEYPEGVAVMLLYQIGELFQSYAVGKSRRSIAALMDIRPDYANIERDGALVEVDPSEVNIGDIIVIKPGERVPLDGVITEGETTLDTAALTGESLPRNAYVGDNVMSGCINLSGLIRVKTTTEFAQSTASKILELVENSSAAKAKHENFITKFSRIYTPAVVISAVLLAVIPPLVIGGGSDVWTDWIGRALNFLVISCPCALVISVPLSFFGGIGGASAKGILIKGGNYMEALAKTNTVVFDKTGTLTEGVFEVSAIHPDEIDADTLLEYSAYAEAYSTHPIALSIIRKYNKELDMTRVTDTQNIAGEGIIARVDGKRIAIGNEKLMSSENVELPDCPHIGAVVHITVDGEYAGHIAISDRIKSTSKEAISMLHKAGISKTVMLTGDTDAVGQKVAQELGIDEVHTEAMPEDKVSIVEGLINNPETGVVAFVGDGINDAPVLARSDIGIAMGGIGSDAAIEAADIVLMDDNPTKIADAIGISKKTLGIVRQNIIFALGVKFAVLILGAFGIVNMWVAVFADVGVSIIAILNAMRAAKYRR